MRDFREFGETVAEFFHVPMTEEIHNLIQHYQVHCLTLKYAGIDCFFMFFEADPVDGEEMGFLPPPFYVNNCDEFQAELKKLREKWAIDDRLRLLKTMPYSEYLQTKEWKNKRALKLEASGYACQICNAAGVQLDVHLRTYERRGAEADGDLIVLCHSCHGIFHRAGKIVRED